MGPPSIRQSAVRLIRRTASRPSRASVGPESRSEATEFREGTPEPSRRRARNSTRAIASAAAVNGCSNPFSAPGALSQSSVFSVILIRTSVFSLDVAHRRWRRDRRRNLDKRGSVRVPSYGSNCGVQGRFGQLSGHKLWRDFQSHAVIRGFSGATFEVAPLFGVFGGQVGFAASNGDSGGGRWQRRGAGMAARWRRAGAQVRFAASESAPFLAAAWRLDGGGVAADWRPAGASVARVGAGVADAGGGLAPAALERRADAGRLGGVCLAMNRCTTRSLVTSPPAFSISRICTALNPFR